MTPSETRAAPTAALAPTSTPKSPASRSARAPGDKSAPNALRHGLSARSIILNAESPDIFTELLTGLEDEFKPQTENERDLVFAMAHARWRMLRSWCIEKGVFDNAIAAVRQQPGLRDLAPHDCQARAFLRLADQSRVLGMIDRTENRCQRQFDRALRELTAQRAARQRADYYAALREAAGERTAKPANKSEQTNPGRNLMRDYISSPDLEARMAAFRDRLNPTPPHSSVAKS